MKDLKIAVLGATGAVGREMVKILEEYNIPIKELRLLASAKSVGTKILFKGNTYTVQEATENSFDGLDYVLGAVGKGLAKTFAPSIVKAGATFIDNSSSFRMNKDVPLVVPEINGQDAFTNNGIIANPNCSTIITLMAVAALSKISPIESMTAATYQAVSGAGQGGIAELEEEMDAIANNREISYSTFPAQIAMNVIPMIGGITDNLYTDEEMKMQNEGRRILHLPELKVTCTCVRVPVMRSHSIAVSVKTKESISIEDAKKAIASFPGCVLTENLSGRDYPTPLDTSDQDLVYVGRIRKDLTCENGLTLWCCGDQIRKGAAANAIQILKLIASAE